VGLPPPLRANGSGDLPELSDCAEVGYAPAIGRPIVGLRTDLSESGDNAAAVVDLQVEHFIKRTGECIVDSDSAALTALGRLLRH
jgi:nucleoside 2-deoxyribosyltransferase